MTTETPEDYEFFRISNIAYDVGLIAGSTTDQGLARARRAIYRAALSIAGGEQRKWSWLRVKDFLTTVASVNEYSIRRDAKVIHEFWIPGTNRQRLDRLPTSIFTERVPNPELATGIPRLFDEQGVDSSGAKVFSFYPVPNDAIEIWYRFTRQILPFKDDSKDIRALWGFPEHMLEPLIQKSAALTVQGHNAERFLELDANAEALIAVAYADDQLKTNTTYRAPMIQSRDAQPDGPMLPPQYSKD